MRDFLQTTSLPLVSPHEQTHLLCLLQEEHGNHLFTAVFGARSVATVIIDDDVAFVWDSRTSGDGTEAGSFEWYLDVGQHSFVVEYVEEAGPDTGGNAFLTWTQA